MSNDNTDSTTSPASATHSEGNGYHADPQPETDPIRERYRLHAQCAKLRHWCRGLLDAEGTKGVLPQGVEIELLATPPIMTMDEVFAALQVISQHEPLPVASLCTGEVTALALERDRLRTHFFALHDAAFDWDDITEEYLLELRDAGPSVSMQDALDQFEQEFGGRS